MLTFDPFSVTDYASVIDLLDSDPEALQCRSCGEDLDSLNETLCQKLQERYTPRIGKGMISQMELLVFSTRDASFRAKSLPWSSARPLK